MLFPIGNCTDLEFFQCVGGFLVVGPGRKDSLLKAVGYIMLSNFEPHIFKEFFVRSKQGRY